MTSAPQIAGAVAVVAAAVIAVVAAVAALRASGVYARLHYPTIVASVSGPLTAVAALLSYGPGLTAAIVALIVLLIALTNPVLAAAVGKSNALADGISEEGSPE